MIKLQGPSYSSGSLDAKYEMLDEIGGSMDWTSLCRLR